MKERNDNKKRTREQLIVDAFRCMIARGEAVRTKVEIPLQTGWVFEKEIYKVSPLEKGGTAW